MDASKQRVIRFLEKEVRRPELCWVWLPKIPSSATFAIDHKHRCFMLNSAWASIELSLRLCTNEYRPHRVNRVNLFPPENEADEDSERGTPTALRFWPIFAL